MTIYSTQCPTRIDLAGGTIDLWPIWAILDECVTINVSIDVYTTCEIQPLETSEIKIESPDMQKTWAFKNSDELYASNDEALTFFKAHIAHWKPTGGFRIATRSMSPVGGGLGGSSSLSVAIYKTFQKWLGKNEIDIHRLVADCSNIEAKVLVTPTGLQDYYGAASVGLNVIPFDSHGPSIKTLIQHQDVFNSSIIVVYTGKSHHSGINNWGVLKKFIDKDKTTTEALKQIRDVALEVSDVCQKGEWARLPELFTQDFSAREKLSDQFMSKEIRDLKKISDAAGAIGFKICGAGGGGCVAVWCPPEKKAAIEQQIGQSGYRVLQTRFL